MHETKNLCYCTCFEYAYVGKASGTAAAKGYDFRMGSPSHRRRRAWTTYKYPSSGSIILVQQEKTNRSVNMEVAEILCVVCSRQPQSVAFVSLFDLR